MDPELAPLKYADDDAARYFDLFRLLGARTYLLARLDDNTRRLHPQAAAEAVCGRTEWWWQLERIARHVRLDERAAELLHVLLEDDRVATPATRTIGRSPTEPSASARRSSPRTA